VERWLKAPMQTTDGQILERDKGTPQGGVVSPLLANLFLHYAFDLWVTRHLPGIRFARYADDAVPSLQEQLARRAAVEGRVVHIPRCPG
jgi:RNA-directed DNA polymerase